VEGLFSSITTLVSQPVFCMGDTDDVVSKLEDVGEVRRMVFWLVSGRVTVIVQQDWDHGVDASFRALFLVVGSFFFIAYGYVNRILGLASNTTRF
jgi:hypothetical protein